MRKIIFVFMALLAYPAAMAVEDAVHSVPPVPDGEVRTCRVRYEDPKLNDAYFANKPVNQRLMHDEASASFETIIRFKGEGKNRQLIYQRNEVLHNRTKSNWTFTFAPGNKLILTAIEHKVFTPTGKQVRHEFFDLSDPIFNYPSDTFHPLTLELFFRALPLKRGYKNQFHLWIAPKSVIRMYIEVEKVETIKVPAGEFECYCLQMFPNLEDFLGRSGRIIQPLVPKYTFWLAVKGSRPVIKYRGPLGEINLGSAPIEIHELVKLTPGL